MDNNTAMSYIILADKKKLAKSHESSICFSHILARIFALGHQNKQQTKHYDTMHMQFM